MKKKIVFSGIQPSGKLTIGNYIGVIKQWVKMQKKYTCIFCIVDLHTITVNKINFNLNDTILDTLSLYLACGVNPKKSIIFIQSNILEHTQLSWILNSYTYYGELKRMTQFKNKLIKYNFKNINSGIFIYPVLMASDILLYKTSYVPIGNDQKQHIELCRNIANRFNNIYGNIFNIPKPCILKYGGKILSLQEPNKKMSKSDGNYNNVIYLLEKKQNILKKIKLAKTDSDKNYNIKYDIINKPGISNILNIFSSLTGNKINEIEKKFNGKMYSDLKYETSKILSFFIERIQENYYNIRNKKSFLKDIIYDGTIKARKIAKRNLNKIKKKINLIK
ncbi:MAG: tryptophan--tRNA ligase [Enterobacteriaceae bacterium PSpicST2]|nr:MAG: tryptophan--tRNA ligase [Enterobacteriaceae bacterium PSpicST2]WMC19045.1 MAG: tryptophan--tRNA ligase [Enterobacteriaceae bacterium PSpicST1]